MNQYSSIVKPAEYQDEINPNLLMRGAETENANTLSNLKGIADAASSVFNIPAYGKDRETLSQIQQGVLDSIKNTQLGDLNNPQSQSSIRGIIRSVTNSPDVQAIAQRGYTYQDMLKEQKEAVKKGENYLNPGKEDADAYYAGADYIKDKTFNNSGFIGANLEKSKAEMIKNLPVTKEWVQKDGVWKEESHVDKNALKDGYASWMKDPNIARTLKYSFDQKYKNSNLSSEAVSKISDLANVSANALYTGKALLQGLQQGTPEYQAQEEKNKNYEKNLEEYQAAKQNPELAGHTYSNILWEQELNADKDNFVKTHSAFNNTDMKFDEASRDYQKHLYRLGEINEENKAKEESTDPGAAKQLTESTKALSQSPAGKSMSWSSSFAERKDIQVANPNGGYSFITPSEVVSQGNGKFKLIYNTVSDAGVSQTKEIPNVSPQDLFNPGGYKHQFQQKLAMGSYNELGQDESVGKLKPPATFQGNMSFKTAKNPKMNYKSSVVWNKATHQWQEAPVITTNEELENLPHNTHVIVDGELKLKP